MIINGRVVDIYGHYYVQKSLCAESFNYHSSSISVGKWHIGKKNQYILEKAIKRFRFYSAEEMEKAYNKAINYIKGAEANDTMPV